MELECKKEKCDIEKCDCWMGIRFRNQVETEVRISDLDNTNDDLIVSKEKEAEKCDFRTHTYYIYENDTFRKVYTTVCLDNESS